MTATTVPAELPISEARAILTDIATAAKEHYAQTTLTKHGKAVAKVVHPDAGVTPDPGLWQAAQEAWDQLLAESAPGHPYPFPQNRRVLDALDALLRSYYGNKETVAAKICVGCGANLTASGAGWVDGDGWDHCPDASDSHRPTKETP